MYGEPNGYSALAGQAAVRLQSAPKAPTPFHQLSGTHERIRGLCGRIQKLAAILVGDVPPQPTAAKGRSTSCGGVFGIVGDSAWDLDEILSSAFADLDRIERQLP